MDNKITIIIPAYNIEKYLPVTLDSVLAQTYENIEAIVVNDGSKDGTGAVIDQYAAKDPRIKAIHKENGGVSSARLKGLEAATGDWIGFVDGDDYVEPEMFAHLLANALAHDADISHCGYQMVFPDGHIDMYYNTGRKECLDRSSSVQALLRGECIEPSLCNKLFHRDLVINFDHSPVWDCSIRINEDLLMNYILFSRSNSSVYEDIPFYHYMLRPGSAATTIKPGLFKVQNPVQVMELILTDAVADPAIYACAFERYLRVLIGAAQQTDWPEEAAKAKSKLKHALKSARAHRGISRKVRWMAFGAAYLQPVYRLIRKIYNRFTGVDKKYDLN